MNYQYHWFHEKYNKDMLEFTRKSRDYLTLYYLNKGYSTEEIERRSREIFNIIICIRHLEEQKLIEGCYIFIEGDEEYLPDAIKANNFNDRIHNTINYLKPIFPNIFNKNIDYYFDNTDEKSPEYLISKLYPHIFRSEYAIGAFHTMFQVDERIIDNLKSYKEGKKYDKKSLKLKTQVFTPSWVCETIVQNTIGAFICNCSNKSELEMQVKYELDYYLRLNKKLNLSTNKIKELKILEPSCGTGNILLAAYDLLEQYYKSQRIFNSQLILNQLYGVDVDSIAIDIATFLLQVKANKYVIRFTDLKYYDVNLEYITDDFGTLNKNTSNKTLQQKYDIVIGNPPYGGNKHFNKNMRNYFKKEYPNTKSDLYTMFMQRGLELLKENGLISFITPRNWMFLSSSEKFRRHVLDNYNILKLFDLGDGVFDNISGAVVNTAIFVIHKNKDEILTAIDLTDVKNKHLKLKEMVYPNSIWNCDGTLGILETLI